MLIMKHNDPIDNRVIKVTMGKKDPRAAINIVCNAYSSYQCIRLDTKAALKVIVGLQSAIAEQERRQQAIASKA